MSRIKPVIRWKDVLHFQFEPAGLNGEFTKFTIQYADKHTPAGMRQWSMILADAAQCGALLSELEGRRAMNHGQFRIVKSDVAIPPWKAFKIRFAGLSFVACFFLLHGIPMLEAGLGLGGNNTQNELGDRRVNPCIVRWVNSHFSSREELLRYYVITGAILTGVGSACIVLAEVLHRRDIKAYRAEIFGEGGGTVR